MRPWLQYTLARLGVFVLVFVVLLLLGIEGWLAAIFATIIALCVSFLALGRLRQRVADDIEARRRGAGAPTLAEGDAEAEDAEIEAGADTIAAEAAADTGAAQQRDERD